VKVAYSLAEKGASLTLESESFTKTGYIFDFKVFRKAGYLRKDKAIFVVR